MKLYICGNGFDQHHNLPTSYEKYKEFLIENYPHIYSGYNDFPYFLENQKSDKWVDIEYNLHINYKKFFEQCVNEFHSDMNDDSYSRWINIDTDIGELTRFINDFTGRAFVEFISNAEKHSAVADLDLDKESLYINFNYTNTLQRLYNISEKSILHIHGSLRNVNFSDIFVNDILPSFSTIEEAEILEVLVSADEWNNDYIRTEIQFGATGIASEQVKSDLSKKYEMDDYYSTLIEPAIDKLVDFVQKSIKNPKKNFDALIKFIEGKEIDEVIVMGVSLGEADDLYYSEILIPKFKNVKWVFMQHGEDDNHIRKFISKYSLSNIDIRRW